MMKLTETKLRKIIREEIESTVNEITSKSVTVDGIDFLLDVHGSQRGNAVLLQMLPNRRTELDKIDQRGGKDRVGKDLESILNDKLPIAVDYRRRESEAGGLVFGVHNLDEYFARFLK